MISAKEAREQSLILSKTELYELKRIELEIKRCILNRECSTKIRIDSNNVLRHTFATRCLENGMNVKTLQRILGHADIRTTMNTYCHVTDDELYSAMNVFEQKGILNTNTPNGVKVV